MLRAARAMVWVLCCERRSRSFVNSSSRPASRRNEAWPRLSGLSRRKLPMSQTLAEVSAPATDLSAATDNGTRTLPVAGFKGTPEEIERQWYEEVYRGHGDSMAQLTWRA